MYWFGCRCECGGVWGGEFYTCTSPDKSIYLSGSFVKGHQMLMTPATGNVRLIKHPSSGSLQLMQGDVVSVYFQLEPTCPSRVDSLLTY